MLLSQKPYRGMQINRTHPLAKGLVGCWVFNEETGKLVFDLSGNGNNGEITGADWVADGLYFDGGTDKVNFGSSDSIDDLSQLTVFIKVNHKSLTYNDKVIAKGSVGSSPASGSWGMYIVSSSSKTYGIKKELLGNDIYNYYTNSAITGQEDTLCFTWNGGTTNTNGEDIAFYINGEFKTPSSFSGGGSFRSDTAYNLEINSLNGYVLSALIYNRVLSAEEVAWLYRKPYAMFRPKINPGILYYEAAAGGNAPTGVFYGPFVGPLGGPI